MNKDKFIVNKVHLIHNKINLNKDNYSRDKFNKEMIKYMIVKVLMMMRIVFNKRKRRGKIFGKL
jgi:hypothetical protein